MLPSIRDLHLLAAQIDGAPVPMVPPGASTGAVISAWNAARARLQAILANAEHHTHPLLPLVHQALAAPMPAEPRFFVAAYYTPVTRIPLVTLGDIEARILLLVKKANGLAEALP